MRRAILPLALLAGAPTAATPAAPTFVPGLYDTESRNSAFGGDRTRREDCLAAPDLDAFRRATVARYKTLPQFGAVCRLSDTTATADGFAFAMDCGVARTIIAFHFATDLVTSTARTEIATRPDHSSTIVTLSRRIGACPRTPGPGR